MHGFCFCRSKVGPLAVQCWMYAAEGFLLPVAIILYQVQQVACVVSSTHFLVYELKDRAAVRTPEPRTSEQNSVFHHTWYLGYDMLHLLAWLQPLPSQIRNTRYIVYTYVYYEALPTAYYQAHLSLSTRCVSRHGPISSRR